MDPLPPPVGFITLGVQPYQLSTDYTFSASSAQDAALAEGVDKPLGVSAYYSGRAYGPAVVQNPDGSLTMVLHILTMQLTSSTSPGVATTSVSSSDEGTGTVGGSVTYTATVAPIPPGAGTPTGTHADRHGRVLRQQRADRRLPGSRARRRLAGHGDVRDNARDRRPGRSDGEVLRRRQLRGFVGRDQRERAGSPGDRLRRRSHVHSRRSGQLHGDRDGHPDAGGWRPARDPRGLRPPGMPAARRPPHASNEACGEPALIAAGVLPVARAHRQRIPAAARLPAGR